MGKLILVAICNFATTIIVRFVTATANYFDHKMHFVLRLNLPIQCTKACK
jgi:hypothetical protein